MSNFQENKENIPNGTTPSQLNIRLNAESKKSQDSQADTAFAQSENCVLPEDLRNLTINPKSFKVFRNFSMEALAFIYGVKGWDTFDI